MTNGLDLPITPKTLDLWWDAVIRGDGFDREGNTYASHEALTFQLAKQQRAIILAANAALRGDFQ